jgi:hypothetical protein
MFKFWTMHLHACTWIWNGKLNLSNARVQTWERQDTVVFLSKKNYTTELNHIHIYSITTQLLNISQTWKFHLRGICDIFPYTMMFQLTKYLYTQYTIQHHEEQEKYGNIVDLLSWTSEINNVLYIYFIYTFINNL